MTWVVPLALGGLAILVMAVVTMVSARRHKHVTVAPAQVVGPAVLIHDINDDRCTGCDACVAVCPTNVLDLVGNKSRVLRFQDCIQCEACMFACPTEALVMFPEGSQPPPLKIPEIDENFQTAVPGQYLIGEVAGKPLVKNAANLGRAVVEHMMTTGLYPGALGPAVPGQDVVDVVIVGSGPGGLSAALTCIQKGLSYVVLEKEQEIASTINRYPKGKLVMAEPYDSENVSLLPVFDSSKEQLIPIWKELIERVRLRVNQGESVEAIQRGYDGAFDVRTTVAAYRAQRVVLSIGTRGKPRTLQVPGENLPKVYSLLDDPDAWSGRNVIVVGGGDSACEAALALADAGAIVMLSYRGKGFNRAAPKNKLSVERYANEGRLKAKLQSQILDFSPDAVTLQLGDGTQKRYANDAAFVLIGADPPVAWLEKVGIRFVDRPHQFQFGKSDDIVRRFVAARACPEDAARAAAQILGGSTGVEPSRAAAAISLPMGGLQQPEKVSGPKKWLRSATSIFSTRGSSVVTPMPRPATQAGPTPMPGLPAAKNKRLDAPVPLSEFAKKKRNDHTGHGRRDQLTAGERTRILRMLRDEGGRLADEESQVHIGAAPPAGKFDFDFDNDVPAAPPSPISQRPDVNAKPAVVVGLEKARNNKRNTAAPPSGRSIPPAPVHAAPPQPPPSRSKAPSVAPPPPPRGRGPTKAPPPPPPDIFDQRTRAAKPGEDILAAIREAPGPGRSAPPKANLFDEPTRLGNVDAAFLDQPLADDGADILEGATTMDPNAARFLENMTPPSGNFLDAATVMSPPMFASRTQPEGDPFGGDDDATRLASADSVSRSRPASPPPRAPGSRPGGKRAPLPRPAPPAPGGNDERTRAVDISEERRRDPSINDVDWDID